jgi:hypothetical protein
VPGPAPQTGAAVAADGAPVQDDEVAWGHIGDVRADRVHGAGGFMAEHVMFHFQLSDDCAFGKPAP